MWDDARGTMIKKRRMDISEGEPHVVQDVENSGG
jgi:hypothetical protein